MLTFPGPGYYKPLILDDVYHLAIIESLHNFQNYGSKDPDFVRRGKLGEGDLTLKNKGSVVQGVRALFEKPDNGIDLIFKKTGCLQVKTIAAHDVCIRDGKPKWINDISGFKKNSYPTMDTVLLVLQVECPWLLAIKDPNSMFPPLKFKTYCARPSQVKFYESSSSNCKYYLDLDKDFIECSLDEDMFKHFGRFEPPVVPPEGDIDINQSL